MRCIMKSEPDDDSFSHPMACFNVRWLLWCTVKQVGGAKVLRLLFSLPRLGGVAFFSEAAALVT